MRFAARESATFAQFESAFGLIPGGGATQYLTRLMGRARALEVLLSAQDYEAIRAAVWWRLVMADYVAFVCNSVCTATRGLGHGGPGHLGSAGPWLTAAVRFSGGSDHELAGHLSPARPGAGWARAAWPDRADSQGVVPEAPSPSTRPPR